MIGPSSNKGAPCAGQLPAEAGRALAGAAAAWASTFGAGSRRSLLDAYARALGDAPTELHAPLRARVEREHREAYGAESLAAEVEEERHRDAATTDDSALVSYEQKWAKRLAKLQRAHPSRWRLPGISDDELRDELTLRLIDAVRTKPEDLSRHHRAGKEWGLLFLAHERRALRKGFKLEVVLTDPSPVEPSPVLERALTEEERLIARESDRALALARERAESGLSKPQRRWFAAMRMTANAGAFFESSGKLNLSAVSRVLDKDRSSAQRAFGELSLHFVRELKKLGG